ncbi:hypothetical protein SELMODRAFT_108104 [Selaginella moellendorffii]|uniref:Uncharacterized protein n=1 Tax=Selaginella moellendorffii TaxID=88036 RepID=D8S3Q4_SELML|nr:hypothetical protein SELMODRAFT_108104 [Selaginella moellendorffii]
MPLCYWDFFRRCELWICAGDKNEKLASGSVKPFVAHLRAAKEQIAKGGSFIILQAPPFVGDGSPWFTKRTVERFVRFVSTPDVLESVSVLEAELAKLDDATSILVSDSSWVRRRLSSFSELLIPCFDSRVLLLLQEQVLFSHFARASEVSNVSSVQEIFLCTSLM